MKCSAEQLQLLALDSSYHDLGTLPSQGIPYPDLKTLYIKPFKLTELRLVSTAAELGELVHLLRAVDNVISYPVEQLTIGDFYYILLWLRIHSQPKSPYVIEWKCDQPFFRHKETGKYLLYTDQDWPELDVLKKEYSATPCDTHNTSVIHDAAADIRCLPDGFSLPDGFDFPRMSVYEERAKAFADPEWKHLAPAIQWLVGATWAEKVSAAEENPELIGEALAINRTTTHGISENVTFMCNKCRIQHTTTLTINALSFFR